MMSFPKESPFPNMPVDGPDRRFMAMPAYLGGKFNISGMKWYGSNVENKSNGLLRSILMLTLNEMDKNILDLNLANISTALGYYDQSHMKKDFYEFTNTTPS